MVLLSILMSEILLRGLHINSHVILSFINFFKLNQIMIKLFLNRFEF